MNQVSRKAKCYMAHFIAFIIEVAIGAFCGWLMSLWALPYAYNFRGYDAVGSEWILILGLGYLGYYIARKGIVHIISLKNDVKEMKDASCDGITQHENLKGGIGV
jgi:hypothetical protein